MNTIRENDELLTSGEAAALLRLNISTIVKWSNKGHLTCVKTLGGHRRFKKSDVLALAEKNNLFVVEPANA